MQIPHPFTSANQRGDTIVEVLIALAVISSVLAGAFFVTNHSAQNVRDTEEHTQALQLLQGQIEQVRADISAGAQNADFPSYFCYDDASELQAASSINDFSKCPNDLGGTSGATYAFMIEKRDASGASPNTKLFAASTQWEGVRGQLNTEQLLYKIDVNP
jgi:prepilin-type N-terminal cleavage/methylation domain-containing protein